MTTTSIETDRRNSDRRRGRLWASAWAVAIVAGASCTVAVQPAEEVVGAGLVAVDGTLQVDQARVPLVADGCAEGETVVRDGAAWACAPAPADIGAELDAVNGRVDAVEADAAALDARVGSVEAGVTALDARVDVLETDAVQLDAAACLAGQIVARNVAGDAFECVALDDGGGGFTFGAGLATAAAGGVVDVSVDFTAVAAASDVAGHETRLDQAEPALAALDADVTAVETDVSAHETRLNAIDGELAAAREGVTSLDVRLDAIEQSVVDVGDLLPASVTDLFTATCDAQNAGGLTFEEQSGGLRVCDGSTFRTVLTAPPPALIADANPVNAVDVGGQRRFVDAATGTVGASTGGFGAPGGAVPAHFDLVGTLNAVVGPVTLPERGYTIELLFQPLAALPAGRFCWAVHQGTQLEKRQLQLCFTDGKFEVDEFRSPIIEPGGPVLPNVPHHFVFVHEDDDTYSFYDGGTRLVDRATPPLRVGYAGGQAVFLITDVGGTGMRWFRLRAHGRAFAGADVDAACAELAAGFASPFACNTTD